MIHTKHSGDPLNGSRMAEEVLFGGRATGDRRQEGADEREGIHHSNMKRGRKGKSSSSSRWGVECREAHRRPVSTARVFGLHGVCE